MDCDPRRYPETGPFAPFRSEHRCLLDRLAELERRVLADGDAPDEGLLAGTLAKLAGRFAAHMADEDAVLFPALAEAFPAGRAALEPLRADHDELRLMMSTMAGWLGTPASEHRLEQLHVVVRDFVDLLRLHIQREETAVFDVASRALSAAESADLGRRIAAALESPSAGRLGTGFPKGHVQ